MAAVSSSFLRVTARYSFFLTLAVAPWFYGGTTSISIVVIDWLLAAVLILWIADLIINRRAPKFPPALIWIVVALLIIGAWMTFNARSVYDAEFATFMRLDRLVPRAPGSVDYAISAAWMIRAALLLLSILFVVDLAREGKYLLQLWGAIALAGGSIALFGLLEKASGAKALFWQTPIMGLSSSTFFASYYYHANAGAFLNLVLPFTAGLALRAFGTETKPLLRATWLTMFLVNVAAIAANTSKMAQLIGILIFIALMWQLGPKIARRFSRSERNVALGGAAAILLVIGAIAATTHLDQPVQRWKKIGEQISVDARWSASGVALRTLPDAGLMGFGPGTFRVIFPSYNKSESKPVTGQWRFLHQDYLETVMEWGWVGSFCWAALFFGGVIAAVFALRKQNKYRKGPKAEARGLKGEWSWRRRLILPMAMIALSGVAIHALVDFPLQIMSIQLYVATCLGLCWSSLRWNNAS